jgi:hypothetical protein
MDIKIYGKPEFTIEFKPELVAALSICADTHYDFRCKSTNQIGGILYGLNVATKYGDGNPVMWYFTWRELDLFCKVCEMRSMLFQGKSITENQIKLVDEFAESAGGALRLANQQTTWEITYKG